MKEKRPSKGEETPISVRDVNASYGNEWVLLQITSHDEHGAPSKGLVLAHGTHELVWGIMDEEVGKGLPLKKPLYVFHAAPRAQTGEEAREILKRAGETQAGDPFRWPR